MPAEVFAETGGREKLVALLTATLMTVEARGGRAWVVASDETLTGVDVRSGAVTYRAVRVRRLQLVLGERRAERQQARPEGHLGAGYKPHHGRPGLALRPRTTSWYS